MEPNGIQKIQQWLGGYAATQILLCSDELGVFEALRENGRDLADLASRLQLPEPSLERLLIAASALGLLLREGDTFSLTPLAQAHLLRGPGYAGGMFHHVKHHLYPLWHHLDDAIRENRAQWSKLPGGDARPFESMYRDPRSLAGFMEAMFSHTSAGTRALLEQNGFDFGRFRHVLDLGGASGGFLIPVLQQFPALQATIFDLPPVEPIARANAERFGLADRLGFLAGDFFRDPLPTGADLIVLGHILHDWNRQDGTLLLRKIVEALPSGGAIFVNEFFLNESKDGPVMPACLNLTMLVATQGEEHTPSEYEQWLREAGFARTETWQDALARGYVVGWKD